MPRSRTSTAKGTTKGASAASGGEAAGAKLVCPECGREFARPAGLGAHRKGAHGVAGTSTNATASRRARSRGRRSAASVGSTRRAGSSDIPKLDASDTRYYDTTTGRFLSPYTPGAETAATNAYGYAANNPTANVDPSGRTLCPPTSMNGCPDATFKAHPCEKHEWDETISVGDRAFVPTCFRNNRQRKVYLGHFGIFAPAWGTDALRWQFQFFGGWLHSRCPCTLVKSGLVPIISNLTIAAAPQVDGGGFDCASPSCGTVRETVIVGPNTKTVSVGGSVPADAVDLAQLGHRPGQIQIHMHLSVVLNGGAVGSDTSGTLVGIDAGFNATVGAGAGGGGGGWRVLGGNN